MPGFYSRRQPRGRIVHPDFTAAVPAQPLYQPINRHLHCPRTLEAWAT